MTHALLNRNSKSTRVRRNSSLIIIQMPGSQKIKTKNIGIIVTL